jgi:hypothetical protein
MILFSFAGAKLNRPDGGSRISVSIQPPGSTIRLRHSDRTKLFRETTMTIRKRGFRALVLGLLVTAGLMLAPAAFAGGHVSIGINLPGVSLGYWGGHHGHGYVSVGGYYGDGYYDGGYYSPVYYDSYYYAPAPVYYAPAPVYYGSYYSAPVYRSHYRSRYYDRGGDPRYYRDHGRGYDYDNDRGYHRGGYGRGYSCGSSDPRYCH